MMSSFCGAFRTRKRSKSILAAGSRPSRICGSFRSRSKAKQNRPRTRGGRASPPVEQWPELDGDDGPFFICSLHSDRNGLTVDPEEAG